MITSDDFDEPRKPGRGFGERRITVSKAKRILGMIARNYSDEEIEGLLDILYGLGEAGFDLYQESLNHGDNEE